MSIQQVYVFYVTPIVRQHAIQVYLLSKVVEDFLTCCQVPVYP